MNEEIDELEKDVDNDKYTDKEKIKQDEEKVERDERRCRIL